ncbi:MAG: DUF1947 domain-containing protein [Desulfonauticus sp.]|nr:DUF1947 domain-containing protein [Desulfonauticus sp.]
MSKRSRRYFLKEKEAKNFLDEFMQKLKFDLKRVFKAKVKIEIVETRFAEIYLINGRPLLAKSEGHVFPLLTFSELFTLAPKIVVDMGAIPYVCNGANIMAPGIVRFEGEFRKGDYVFVVDEKHGKPLALGIIDYDVDKVGNVNRGVVVKNLHFVGDKIWNFIKKLEVASRRR